MANSEDNPDNWVADSEELMKEEERKEHPDYRITVYCDHHLGVNMHLATSWGSVEYGETLVDANPSHQWLCPKPDCIRCYERTMFGYHWNSGKPGTRRQMNQQKQPRGNHPDLPFMYIGKVGEGRRFMCPFYKCDEKGPEVAASVVDEEVESPTNPLDDLRGDERKRAFEMSVFKSFASVSGLPIDEGSPDNGAQYYPDIGCTISGERSWFELGQIIHEEVAEKLSPKRRKEEGGFSYDQETPFVTLVSDKATKRYETEGATVDLVLHFDLRLGTAASVQRLIEKHGTLLESLTTSGPFKRVWIFDDHTKEIVWRSRS
jgi:hypothetical protein